MHFGIFKVTAKQRYILGIVFWILNFIQVLLGMLMTGGSIYIVITVSPKFYSEKAEITFVFTVTGMFGTHVVITYLVGIKIGDKCTHLAHKKSTGRHLIVWTMGSFNTTINILIIASLASKISRHIIRSLRHSLEKGIHNYLKDPNWKHVLDKWQFNLQCCGVDSYEDWMKVTWLDGTQVSENNKYVQQIRTSKEHLHLPVLPWSCCRYNFPMQCFHDPLQQINSRHLWTEQPTLVTDSINTNGCLNVLRTPVETALFSLVLISVFLIIFQFIIIIISRLLYTSCKNAVILGDPDGVAPAWIFTRGFFSRRTEQTISEILIDLGIPRKNIARYQAFDKNMDAEDKHNNTINVKKSASKVKTALNRIFKQEGEEEGTESDNKRENTENSDADPISSADEEALMLH